MTEPHTTGTPVTKLLELAQADPARLQELERFRRTLVVMFSDIQGSTAYFEKHGDAAGLFMVHQCHDTVRRLVEKQGGTVIKTIGDGVMSTFPAARSAVDAAIEIQTELAKLGEGGKEPERIALRIGMHYGAGIVRTKDVFGDVVNMASRVQNVAAPGQIVVSEEIYQQLQGCGFTLRELGRFTLKGKTGEHTLFRVVWNQVQGALTECGAASLDASVPASCLKLQVVNPDGSAGAEYLVQSGLGLGLSPAKDVIVSPDSNFPGVCAHIYLQDQTLFIEEVAGARESVFFRLAGSYVLEHEDIFLAGHQLIRYEEKPEALTSLTVVRTLLPDVDPATLDIAELVRIDTKGNPAGRYPLSGQEVSFGRTRGTHTFPEDKLMSRAHMRISLRGEDFVLEDLGSRNGTFVKVRGKSPLSAGSALLIAARSLRVIQ